MERGRGERTASLLCLLEVALDGAGAAAAGHDDVEVVVVFAGHFRSSRSSSVGSVSVTVSSGVDSVELRGVVTADICSCGGS